MVRSTRQRAAVSAVFADLEGFLSAQDVHARLRSAGNSVGLSTVYRTVLSLADDGELDCLRTDAGETLYRRCSRQHHHHLVCRGCGLTVEVAGPAVELWADRVAGEHGFADVSHTLEIVGTCAGCRAAGLPTGPHDQGVAAKPARRSIASTGE
jgi:Fur family ferric uptake transcriptional regulator